MSKNWCRSCVVMQKVLSEEEREKGNAQETNVVVAMDIADDVHWTRTHLKQDRLL